SGSRPSRGELAADRDRRRGRQRDGATNMEPTGASPCAARGGDGQGDRSRQRSRGVNEREPRRSVAAAEAKEARRPGVEPVDVSYVRIDREVLEAGEVRPRPAEVDGAWAAGEHVVRGKAEQVA